MSAGTTRAASTRAGGPLRVPALLAIACWLVAAGWVAAWLGTGRHFATQYQVATTETVEDEFGDAVTLTRMEDRFRLGLFPDRPWDGAGTNALGFAVLGAVLWWRGRKRSSAAPASGASAAASSPPDPSP